jgi:hypothetical protein
LDLNIEELIVVNLYLSILYESGGIKAPVSYSWRIYIKLELQSYIHNNESLRENYLLSPPRQGNAKAG